MNAYTIRAHGIGKRFSKKFLFRNIDLELRMGESLCVTGPNGSGKSTLLRILACLLPPTEGTVDHLRDDGIPSTDPWAGYTGPLVNPYPELTVMENLTFASRGNGSLSAGAIIEALGLDEYRNRQVRHCSSGTVQRLRLAAAAVNNPPALILDEPTMNLDDEGKERFERFLDRMRAVRIIIIATNDRSEERICGRVVRLGL